MGRYNVIALTVHKDILKLFDFLKDSPSAVYHDGVSFLFVYFKQADRVIFPFSYRGVRVEILETDEIADYVKDWEQVRAHRVAIAPTELLTALESVEKRAKARGAPLVLNSELIDFLTSINDLESLGAFVKLFDYHGYSAEDILTLYAHLRIRKSLDKPFFKLFRKVLHERRQEGIH